MMPKAQGLKSNGRSDRGRLGFDQEGFRPTKERPFPQKWSKTSSHPPLVYNLRLGIHQRHYTT